MPPKRQSTESASAANGSKRSRPDESPDASEILPNPRYTKGSITSFFDVQYKELLRDTEKAFSLVSQCGWRFVPVPGVGGITGQDEDEDEDESDSASESETPLKKLCQDPCFCNKPAAKDTKHPWLVSYAGARKATLVKFLTSVRDTWNFAVHTFKYHEMYGMLELLENLVLDFDEEEGNWKNQWAICEAIGSLFMCGAAQPIFQIDDRSCLIGFCYLVQIMFLTMLATLERQKLLGPDSEVKNLGAIMGIYVLIAAEIGSKDSKLSETRHTSKVIMVYAAKYGVTVQSPSDLTKELARRKITSRTTTIPKPTANDNDPWSWCETLDDYKVDCLRPSYAFKGGPVGGDRLDITSWTPEERAKYSFAESNGILSQSMLDSFKRGEVPLPI